MLQLLILHILKQIIIESKLGLPIMNTAKLVEMITKKDRYKETKPIQADIMRKKQQAVSVSISAIHQILKDQKQSYNVQSKLYAIRYLKDCFEKGNESFISKTQAKILPFLVKIVKDSKDSQAIQKYGKSYPKETDLKKFKQTLVSLFAMCRECIQKWATWIPDNQRGFVKAQRQVSEYGWNKVFNYFRQQNYIIFKQNYQKNQGKSLEQVLVNNAQQQTPKPRQKLKKQQKIVIATKTTTTTITTPTIQPIQTPKLSGLKPLDGIMTILNYLQARISKNQKFTQKQFAQQQAKFNTFVNQYIESAEDFDQHFMQQKLEKFQQLRTANSKKQINSNKKVQQNSLKNIQNIQKTSSQISNLQLNTKQPLVSPSFKNVINTNENRVQQKEKIMSFIQKQTKKDPKQLATQLGKQEPPKIVVIQPKVQQKSKGSQIKQGSGHVWGKNNKNGGYNTLRDQQERVSFPQSDDQEQSYDDRKKLITPKTIPITTNVSNIIKKPQSKIERIQSNQTAKFILQQHGSPQLPKPVIKNQNIPLKANLSLQQPVSQPLPVPINNSHVDLLTKNYNMQTKQLNDKIEKMQREMQLMREKQQKLLQKSQKSVDPRQIDSLKKQLYQQKNDKYLMGQQIAELKAELKRIKNDNQKSKTEWKSFNSVNVSQTIQNQNQQRPSKIKSPYKLTKVKQSLTIQNQNDGKSQQAMSRVKSNILPIQSPVAINPYSARIDQDYINNMTYYDKIRSWLSEQNQLLFKKSILGISQKFYQDQSVTIYKLQHLFGQNGADFLKMTFNYHFTRMQYKLPKIMYKNIAEVDFWTKPINGQGNIYTQQTIGRLCLVPIKIMKATLWYDDNNRNLTFLLPFLFYNYLKPIQFQLQQFDDIMNTRNFQIVKSKVIHLNGHIACTAVDLQKVMKQSILSNQYLQMCLSQESQQRVYMTQIQLLRNQKAVIRVLPIPHNPQMVIKAKQLINNLVYLLST